MFIIWNDEEAMNALEAVAGRIVAGISEGLICTRVFPISTISSCDVMAEDKIKDGYPGDDIYTIEYSMHNSILLNALGQPVCIAEPGRISIPLVQHRFNDTESIPAKLDSGSINFFFSRLISKIVKDTNARFIDLLDYSVTATGNVIDSEINKTSVFEAINTLVDASDEIVILMSPSTFNRFMFNQFDLGKFDGYPHSCGGYPVVTSAAFAPGTVYAVRKNAGIIKTVTDFRGSGCDIRIEFNQLIVKAGPFIGMNVTDIQGVAKISSKN